MSLVLNVEETSKHFFALGPNFLDPQTTTNGENYGTYRYKQIIKECYIIAKNCNTPYTDLLDITPSEKVELLNLIIEENKKMQMELEKATLQQQGKKGRKH